LELDFKIHYVSIYDLPLFYNDQTYHMQHEHMPGKGTVNFESLALINLIY